MHIRKLAVEASWGLDLWLVDLETPPSSPDAPSPGQWLSAAEQARAARFHFQRDAHRYRASHTALRHLLSERTGRAPATLELVEGSHGKPRLAFGGAPAFNMSHSGRWALIGVGLDRPLGVDIEAPRDMDSLLDLAERNFSADENRALRAVPTARQQEAFLRCWTRKEACLKAVGSGLSIEPSVFEAGIARAMCGTTLDVQGQACAVQVVSVDLPVDALAAVAWIEPASRHLEM